MATRLPAIFFGQGPRLVLSTNSGGPYLWRAIQARRQPRVCRHRRGVSSKTRSDSLSSA